LSASRLAVPEGPTARRALFPSFRREAAAADPVATARAAAQDLGALRERARREAFEAGQHEGRAAAYEEWTLRLAEAAASLERAGQLLLAQRAELAVELDRQLPRVLLLLARKVIPREGALEDSAEGAVIRKLTERLAGWEEPVAVRLNPRAAEALEAWRAQPGQATAAVQAVRIEADASLAAGEWQVETRDGFLDGRIESQLEEAWRLLTEASA
jgi:flagellar biosynthesis/type III secretory pathway protein FliH